MKKLKLTFIFSLLTIFVFSQKIGTVTTPNVDEFPKVEFVLNLHKPDAKKTQDFELIEDRKILDFDMTRSEAEIVDSQKHILILFEDMTSSSHARQRKYFRYVLENALPKFVNKGDKINIAAFDRNRGEETSLRFLLDNYTDNIDALIDAANSFESIYDRHSNEKSSELYDAIHDGLKELNTKFPNKNSFVLELSAGFNLSAGNAVTQTDLVAASREYNIPIYSVYYNIYDTRTNNEYAEKSYGKFFLSDKKRNDEEAATEKVTEFMKSVVKRHYGYNYAFSYTSEIEQDGELHSLIIKADGQPIEEKFKVPSCNIVCFFTSKPEIAIPLAVFLIALIVGVFIFLKKKKEKEKAEQEKIQAEQEEKLRQLEIKQQKDKEDQQLAEEENRIETARLNKQREDEQKRFQQQMENEKRAEQEQRERAERNKKEAENMEILIQEMQNNRGGLPLLKIVSHGLNKEFLINKPTITFGREKSQNDYYMQEPTVSGKHFKIYYRSSEYFIEDLNSANGTKINGTRVNSHKLRHNDIIQAGKLQMMFVW